MKKPRRFAPLDLLPIVLTAALAVAVPLWTFAAPAAKTVRVTTPTEEFTLPLTAEGSYDLQGHDGLHVTLTVKDGAATVTSADCPDRLCVQTGTLTKAGQAAVCVPAGIVVTVEATDDTAPDAVAR